MSAAIDIHPRRAAQPPLPLQQQQKQQLLQQHHQKQQSGDQTPDEAEIEIFHTWIETICDPDIELGQEFVFNFVRNCSSRRYKKLNHCERCAKKGRNMCVSKLHQQVTKSELNKLKHESIKFLAGLNIKLL